MRTSIAAVTARPWLVSNGVAVFCQRSRLREPHARSAISLETPRITEVVGSSVIRYRPALMHSRSECACRGYRHGAASEYSNPLVLLVPAVRFGFEPSKVVHNVARDYLSGHETTAARSASLSAGASCYATDAMEAAGASPIWTEGPNAAQGPLFEGNQSPQDGCDRRIGVLQTKVSHAESERKLYQ